MIAIQDLSAGYDGVNVIHNISFKAQEGKLLCVLGPNGCGKSTLLKSIARIINYSGTITLDGLDITAIPRKTLAQNIAFLGQVSQVYFPYTVYETIALGRYPWSTGLFKNLSAEDKTIINTVIGILNVGDIQDRMIDSISGGQLQRVFLARTLAQTPDVILLDEPTNHLDLQHQTELLAFLKSYIQKNNKILICVFHDLNLARHFGDTALLMDNGTVAACGSIEETLNSETSQAVYGMDVCGFMRESLGKWK